MSEEVALRYFAALNEHDLDAAEACWAPGSVNHLAPHGELRVPKETRPFFRPNMLHVGYRIEEDDNSLISYTYDARVMTIDPVSTGAPGWKDFLAAYNEFCSEHGGKPLFNQTGGLKSHHVRRAFGDRLDTFEDYRRRCDPADRLLNPYFCELLQGG